jgi:hypothetical protein
MFVEPPVLDNSDIIGLLSEPTGLKWFSVFSHLAFVLPAVVAGVYRDIIPLALSLFALVISEGYHICAEFDVCSGLPLYWWRVLDRETATMVIIAIVSFYIGTRDDDFKPKNRLELQALGMEEKMHMYELDATNLENIDVDEADIGARFDPALYHVQFARFWLIVVLITSTLAIIIFQLDISAAYVTIIISLYALNIYDALFHMERNIPLGNAFFVVGPRQVHIWWTVAEFASGAIALFFFFFPSPGNSLLHSFWHIFGALTLTFGVLSKNRRPEEPLVLIEVWQGHNGSTDFRPEQLPMEEELVSAVLLEDS